MGGWWPTCQAFQVKNENPGLFSGTKRSVYLYTLNVIRARVQTFCKEEPHFIEGKWSHEILHNIHYLILTLNVNHINRKTKRIVFLCRSPKYWFWSEQHLFMPLTVYKWARKCPRTVMVYNGLWQKCWGPHFIGLMTGICGWKKYINESGVWPLSQASKYVFNIVIGCCKTWSRGAIT